MIRIFDIGKYTITIRKNINRKPSKMDTRAYHDEMCAKKLAAESILRRELSAPDRLS